MARKKGRDIDGVLVLNKPLGMSSNHALQRVKRLFNANKAGHTGALDPQASGVLPICLGEATKFSQRLLDADKAYLTVARLGEVRSTGDSEGSVIDTQRVPELSTSDIEAALAPLRGKIEQTPPLFSALKLNGKPLYELARQGLSAQEAQAIGEKKRRQVTIFELNALAADDAFLQSLPTPAAHNIGLRVRCSKGTYIRSLVEDIGQALGCGAYVSKLHRIQAGPYDIAQAFTLEQLEAQNDAGGLNALDALLKPAYSSVAELPKLHLTSEQAQKIGFGQQVETGMEPVNSIQLWVGDNAFMGLGHIDAQGVLRAQRLLRL